MKHLILSLIAVVLPQLIFSQTFSNTANVCPADLNTTGTTSVIAVTGTGTTLTSITVNIPNISHTWYDDLDIMLISPTGQRIILMSDCGGNNSGTGNRNYTFIQGGTVLNNGAAPTASGNVSPTDYEADATWPDGAATITAMNQFTGNPNGNWTLRVRDDGTGDTGCLIGGWSITIAATTPSIPPLCAGSPTAPVNSATGVSNNPTLSWPAVAGAAGYDIYFGTANPATTLVVSNQVGTTYNPGTLATGTTYYWSVVPRNAAGQATGCSTWNFTTCTPTGNPATYGAGSWIGYVYNSAAAGAFTSYQGFVTEATVFNRTHSTASGATINHCSTNQDLFAIRYRNTTNFPAGVYTFTVGGDDGVRFSIDGGATWLINQWVDQGYTTVTSAAVSLSGNINMVLEYYENGGGSQSSFNYTFSPDPCSTIVPLTCGTATNYSMTASSGAWNSYGGAYAVPGQEKIFSFTPTVSGVHNVVVNSSAGYVDLFWKAASVGCNTTSWAYVNDIFGTETWGLTLTAGVQYYILLDDEDLVANTGTITINCPTPPAWQSSWVSMNTGSANWCAGETRNITVTVTNTGINTWTNATPDVNIGVKWNADADYFVRANANSLVSGATQTFTFSVTAPSTPGYNNLSFDVVNEGNFWFANNAAGVGPGNIVYVSSPISIIPLPTVNAGSNLSVCSASNTQLSGTATGTVISEQFENVATMGWTTSNMSSPAGIGSWFQGNSAVFTGQSGGYIGVNFNSVAGNNTISNWLISPEMTINNGDVISFYTRNPGGFADRLQLRLSTNGTSMSVGADANSIGDFTTLLLDINPTLAPTGYPATWTQYTVTISGLGSPVSGRIAFRYFVTSGGPAGANSDYVGIDNYTYTPVINSTWSPGTSLSSTTILNPVASPVVTTTYTLTANQLGCVNSSNVTITVNNPTLATTPTNGDMVWKGAATTDWATLGNWWQYNGTSYGAATAAPTAAQNVIIPANQTCVLNQPNTFANAGNAKTLRIENGANLTMGNGTLTVAENWVNNGTFTPGTGTVAFTGTGNHSVSGSSATHAFNNLTMNKNGEIILSVPIIIAGSLTLTDGRLNIVNFNLDLPTNTINGGNASSYVKTSGTGTLNRNVAGIPVSFPVGRSAYNAAILTNSGTADKYSIRVIDNVTDIGTNADAGATTSMAVVNRTWMINEQVAGGSNVTLGLNWNGAPEHLNGFQPTNAFIAHYMSGAGLWDNIGGAVATNTIETPGITSFSPFTISSDLNFAPLPVELMSFSSSCLDNDVAIKWTTASENNSMHFIVETSTDALNWEVLSVVPAAQFSTSILNYAITHEGAAREKNYYRLKQVDLDGAVELFNVIYANCGNAAGNPVVFPNPSNGDFTIDFSGAEMKGVVQLSIMNAEGKEISTREVNLEEGVSTYQFNNMEPQPGIYYLKIVDTTGRSFIIKHSFI
jgi:subtilisin-like proprotein convertase family protein